MNGTPLAGFSDNEVYGAAVNGMTYWWLGASWETPHSPAGVIKNLTAWHTYGWPLFGYESNQLTIDGLVGGVAKPI